MKKILITICMCLSVSAFTISANTNTIDQADYNEGLQLLESEHYIEALKAFGRAAKEGNSDAQYQIGMMFLEGQGMKTNQKDAAYWFRKAAQNGHAPSQYRIGLCFLHGVGVQSDDRMAAEWLWRSAEQNYAPAALALARLYRDGCGTTKDLHKAKKYYTTAVKAGIPQAQVELDSLSKLTDTSLPKSRNKVMSNKKSHKH